MSFGAPLTRREFLKKLGLLGLGLVGTAVISNCSSERPAPSTDAEGLREARWYESSPRQTVQSQLCFRGCIIAEGERGFCRFFPAYRLTGLPPTPVETLEAAVGIADGEGLQYVYIGNLPGHERNSTFCPRCGERIIQRIHCNVLSVDVEQGKCRFCGHEVPGIWG